MSRKPAAKARPGAGATTGRARRLRQSPGRPGPAPGGGGGRLARQLWALGLKLREVPGDGNCLFRALADQLEGHSRNHLRHRQETVDYMIQQREDFEPFVEDDVSFERHVSNLAKPGTFAGNDAIVAFARNNQMNVVIHQLNTPLWQIRGTDKSNARELHIAYRDGEHYDSVRRISDDSEAPAYLQMELCLTDQRKLTKSKAGDKSCRSKLTSSTAKQPSSSTVANALPCRVITNSSSDGGAEMYGYPSVGTRCQQDKSSSRAEY